MIVMDFVGLYSKSDNNFLQMLIFFIFTDVSLTILCVGVTSTYNYYLVKVRFNKVN